MKHVVSDDNEITSILFSYISKNWLKLHLTFIAIEPAERRREAGEAAENSASRRSA